VEGFDIGGVAVQTPGFGVWAPARAANKTRMKTANFMETPSFWRGPIVRIAV
jgi:hypothetical protein